MAQGFSPDSPLRGIRGVGPPGQAEPKRKNESISRQKAAVSAVPPRRSDRSAGPAGRILYWTGGGLISASSVLPRLWETLRSFQPESWSRTPLVEDLRPSVPSTTSMVAAGRPDTSCPCAPHHSPDRRGRRLRCSPPVGERPPGTASRVQVPRRRGLIRPWSAGVVRIPFQAVLTPLFIDMHCDDLVNPARARSLLHHVHLPAALGC